MKLRKACFGILAIACVAAASACSSSSSTSTADASPGSSSSAAPASSAGSNGVTQARTQIAALLTEPANIPATTPLPHAPEKGIKVAFLTCSAAACSLLNPGFTAAAKALGWDPNVITYNSATAGQARAAGHRRRLQVHRDHEHHAEHHHPAGPGGKGQGCRAVRRLHR